MCTRALPRQGLPVLRNGDLPARKIGRRTVVLVTDLQKYLEALPKLGSAA